MYACGRKEKMSAVGIYTITFSRVYIIITKNVLLFTNVVFMIFKDNTTAG